jgi:hypothetical protein
MLYQNPRSSVILPQRDAKKSVAFTEDEQKLFLFNCPGETTFENPLYSHLIPG